MPLTAMMILDRNRLRAEHAQLGRLAVALTSSGCNINSLLPDPPFGDQHPADKSIGLGEALRYEERVAPWLKNARLIQICKSLELDVPDLLWVAGRDAWQLASGIARNIERPMVIQLDGYQEARRLRRIPKSTPLAGVIAPSRRLTDLVANERPGCEVQYVPPAIAIGSNDTNLAARDAGGPLSIAIIGDGHSKKAYRALFEALAELKRTGEGFQCALELDTTGDQRIWNLVQRMDLTSVTTVIGDPARMPRLVAASDILIRPTVEDRVRPIILEAMAQGTPVVSVPEPWFDDLGEDQGVTINADTAAGGWRGVLEPLFLDASERTRLGGLARTYVTEHHRSSDQAEEIKALFNRIVGVEAIPLEQSR